MDPELVAGRDRARDLCQDLNATREPGRRAAPHPARLFGKAATPSDAAAVLQRPPLSTSTQERVFFSFNCVVLDRLSDQIGSYTLFGPAVQIYTPMHPMNAEQRRLKSSASRSRSDRTCGSAAARSSFQASAIGSRTVIGAGGVIERSIPEGVFAAGNPCRVIREDHRSEAPRGHRCGERDGMDVPIGYRPGAPTTD